MKTLLALALVILLSILSIRSFAAQEALQPAAALEQHEWLQQLVGEWEFTSEAIAEPGTEAVVWKSRESSRSIGGLWIVSEGTADSDGETFTSLMTIGYDANKETFVGSWIDSIQTTMWTYVGSLDDSKRILTLEATGPSMDDPNKTTEYRDQIELIGKDKKRLTSSALAKDGTWTVYMAGEAVRVK